MPEALTKGGGFVSVMKYYRELFTPEEMEKAIALMPPAAKQLIDQPPLAMSWIPFMRTIEIVRAIEKVVPAERAQAIMEEVGRRLLHADLRGIYKVLIRVATIDFVLKKAGQLYGQYLKDGGTLEIDRISEVSCLARYRDLPANDILWGYSLAGSVRGALEAVGAKDPKVKRVESVRGNGLDVLVEWS